MVFLTSTAECFFRPFHDVENSLGYRRLIKPPASKGFTFAVSGFEGVDQLGISVYRQIGVV
ncbi:MAG: hypothetical protein PHQ24_12435, partial [Proteiniphilum sp.]|nr:hypothetical protein [Proteiniphilum sp.]